MSAKKNLIIAKLAVSYVRGQLNLKAGNKLKDAIATGLKSSGIYIPNPDGTRTVFPHISDGMVQKIRRIAKTTSLKLGSSPKGVSADSTQSFGKVRWMAQVAKKSGFGNCNEHAACAFMFLHQIHRAKPLDLMKYTGKGDHVFVVIGRASGSKAGDYKTWGKNAIVCDAWGEKAFLGSNLPKELVGYNKGYGYTSSLRLD